MLALNLRVWWDVKCLKPGQEWEEGFADGLFASRVFVPVLSKAALASFANLQPDSRCDNVLLEHELALEQQARGKMGAIFPVFVGELEDGKSSRGDFFKTGGMPAFAEDIVVAAVDGKAREHLERRLGARRSYLRVEDRTPRGAR